MRFKKFKFKKVNSTNNTAIRIIKNTNLKYGMIISETQTKGRGQYGKKWVSYKGNLFVSFFFTFENFKVSLKKISKINCQLVKKLLFIYYQKKIIFKEPNDLLINKKKICGILQETVEFNNNLFLIIGVGINLIKNPEFKNYPTTNIYKETSIKISKKILIKRIINEFK